MKRGHIIALGVFIALILLVSLGITFVGKVPMTTDVRPLGLFYLKNSYFGNYAARSPEVVTSILWDYRGLDTLFETGVFFLAIISALALFRIEKKEEKVKEKGEGFTFIVKDTVRIISVLIVAVSAAIALHGHLTPGGGFQGGSALAVVPLLIIVAFSKYALEERGLTKDTAMIVRSIGLISIIILVLIPLAAGGYLMQNLPVFPSHIFGQLTSGSLVFYNLFEYIAVGAGFTAVFLLLSIPEKVFHEILGGEKE